MKVVIVDSRNIKEIIDIFPNETIKAVKEKIKLKKGINTDIILHANGNILEDNDLVDDYDIEENSCIIFMGNFRGGNCKANDFYSDEKRIREQINIFRFNLPKKFTDIFIKLKKNHEIEFLNGKIPLNKYRDMINKYFIIKI